MAAKKTPAKKAAATKTAKGKTTAGKTATKATPAKKAPASKSAAKKKPATKAPAKKTAAAKVATKKKSVAKATGKKVSATKSTAKKVSAKKTAAKKATATKTTAKKTAAGSSKVPANRTAPADRSTARTKGTTTKTPAKTAPETESFSPRFLEIQHQALIDQRATYERQSRSLRDEAESLVEDFQSGDVQFDEESGEGDTLNVAREQDLMMSSQALQAIEEIDHALAKFDLGTYGICEVSGKPIPKARLEAIPWARERVEYKVGGLTSR